MPKNHQSAPSTPSNTTCTYIAATSFLPISSLPSAVYQIPAWSLASLRPLQRARPQNPPAGSIRRSQQGLNITPGGAHSAPPAPHSYTSHSVYEENSSTPVTRALSPRTAAPACRMFTRTSNPGPASPVDQPPLPTTQALFCRSIPSAPRVSTPNPHHHLSFRPGTARTLQCTAAGTRRASNAAVEQRVRGAPPALLQRMGCTPHPPLPYSRLSPAVPSLPARRLSTAAVSCQPAPPATGRRTAIAIAAAHARARCRSDGRPLRRRTAQTADRSPHERRVGASEAAQGQGGRQRLRPLLPAGRRRRRRRRRWSCRRRRRRWRRHADVRERAGHARQRACGHEHVAPESGEGRGGVERLLVRRRGRRGRRGGVLLALRRRC